MVTPNKERKSFRVLKYYKQTFSNSGHTTTSDVYFNLIFSSCGRRFENDSTYLFFIKGTGLIGHDIICSPTGKISEPRIQKYISKLEKKGSYKPKFYIFDQIKQGQSSAKEISELTEKNKNEFQNYRTWRIRCFVILAISIVLIFTSYFIGKRRAIRK